MLDSQSVNKPPVLIWLFLYLTGALLLVTAAGKLISASGSAHILQIRDPVLELSFQRIFEVVGALEFIVALICLFSKRLGLKAGLVAWLATSFLVYRFGLI